MKLSVRQKFLLFTVVPILAIYSLMVACGLTYLHHRTIEHNQVDLTERVSQRAESFGLSLKGFSAVTRANARTLENLPSSAPANLYALLRDEMRDNPRIYGMALAFEPHSYQGKNLFCPYVCRDGDGLRQIDIASVYDYTKPKWEWYYAARRQNQALWTQPYFDDGAGNTLMTTYSVPFYRGGKFWGIATVDVKLWTLQDGMGLKNSADGEFLVISDAGRYLSQELKEFSGESSIFELARQRHRPDLRELGMRMLSGGVGIVRMPGLHESEPYWWAYAPVVSTHWGMALRVPERRLLEPVRQQMSLAVFGLGVSLVCIVLTVWSVSFRVTRPLAKLEDAAQQLARGDLDIALETRGSDEVARLGQAFSSMAEQLARREETLRDSRGRRLAHLLEGLGGKYFYYSLAPSGTHNYVSASVETALGYSPDDYLANYASLFTNNQLNLEQRRHTQTALSGGTPPIFEAEMRHRDGRVRRFEICERPLLDSLGQVVSVEGLANDVTERRLSEETLNDSQQRFHMAAEVGGISYWAVDLRTRESWIQGQAGQFLPESNHSPSLLQHFSELILPEDRSIAVEAHEACARGDIAEYEAEYRIRTPRGEVRWLMAKGASVAHDEAGHPIRLAGILLDVTERHEAGEALRASQARLAKITDNAPGLIYQFLLHPDGSMSLPYASDWCRRVLHLEPRDLTHDVEPFLAHIHPDDRDRFRRTTLVSGRYLSTWHWEGRFVLPDGRNLAMQGHSVPEKLEDGSILWNGVLSDISDLKRTEEALRTSEARANSIIQNMQGGYWQTSLDGTVQHANAGLAEILGYDTADELVGKNAVWDIFLNPEDRNGLVEVLALEHSVDAFEFVWKRKDGSPVWVEDNVHLVYDEGGEPIAMEGLVRDVTSQRQARDALELARRAADEANQAKSDFLANMSHEIRTPMNAILGMTHLTLHTPLSDKQRGYVQKIDVSARNLLGIINDILDFSKIEAGRLELEWVDFSLETTLSELADTFALRAVEKQVELLFRVNPDVPSVLVGDPLRLGQILINLVGNALKFTESGEVEVLVEAVSFNEPEQPANSWMHQELGSPPPVDAPPLVELQFSVRDTGIGLSSSHLDRLFQSFTQADSSTTRKYGGTGLGLTICKRLAQLMNGEIWVESELGVGSVFHFTVHLGFLDNGSTAAGELARGMGSGLVAAEMAKFEDWQTLAGKRALVVDDNGAAREILGNMLESFGFAVNYCVSGEEAFETLLTRGNPTVDIVFLDWNMPGWDGLETARRLHASLPKGSRPPVVMVTAYGRDEVLRHKDNVPFQAFLSKPVGPSSLSNAVQQVFGQRTIKVLPPGGAGLHPIKESVRALRGARILLVEDNEINQEVATEILQRVGVMVTVVSNGSLALDMLEADEFDGVLMDVQMPGLDGYETTRRVRARETVARVPIVAMTANAMAGDRERCLEAGMDAHVTKPIDVEEFFEVLSHWVHPAKRTHSFGALGAEEDRASPVPSAAQTNWVESGRDRGLADAAPREVPEWDLPGVDLASALARVGHNETLLWRLLSMFLAGHGDAMARISHSLESGDAPAAQRLLHNLKGVAGNLGARDVMNLAAALEAALLRDESGQEWKLPLQELSLALLPLLDAISGLDQRRSDLTKPPVSHGTQSLESDAVADLLDRLQSLLEEDDSRARLVVLELRPQLAGTRFATDLTLLENSVDRYDFEGARLQIKHWELTQLVRGGGGSNPGTGPDAPGK